jgi:hypothetical protein
MEEQFLQELGRYIVYRVRMEMATPKPRYTKAGSMPKPFSPYNTIASGRLKDSVATIIRDGLIYLVMEDYGVENVYSDLLDGDSGSWPGGGRFRVDTRPPEARQAFSPLIEALTRWAQAKIGLSLPQAKGMAFAVRKNLFKAGYAGIPLITPSVNDDIIAQAEILLNQPQYEGLYINKILDRLVLIGQSSYNINLG